MVAEDMGERYAVERYGHGYIVADYSGKRGRHGAAYVGTDGEWQAQPVRMPPFATEADAKAFIKSLEE